MSLYLLSITQLSFNTNEISCMYIYALSHEYFVDVYVQLEWQPRTRRVRGCHSNCTQTSTKYEGDNAIVINTKIYGNCYQY